VSPYARHANRRGPGPEIYELVPPSTGALGAGFVFGCSSQRITAASPRGCGVGVGIPVPWTSAKVSSVTGTDSSKNTPSGFTDFSASTLVTATTIKTIASYHWRGAAAGDAPTTTSPPRPRQISGETARKKMITRKRLDASQSSYIYQRVRRFAGI